MLNGTIELADLLSQPSLVAELTRDQLAELAGQCERLKALCWARLMSITATVESRTAPDRMLTPTEASEILRRPVRWIARRRATLPFVVRMSERSYVCSERGVRLWLKQHES